MNTWGGGFILAQTDNEPVQFSSQFKVFMTDKKTQELNQENRIFRLWFYNFTENQCLYDAHAMLRSLFKSDEFPRGKRKFELLYFNVFKFFSRLFFFY
jgi:hypothetical protein